MRSHTAYTEGYAAGERAGRLTTKPSDKDVALLALAQRLAVMPLSTDDLQSTWCPPEWEQVVEWWDEYVAEARKLTGNSYREKA